MHPLMQSARSSIKSNLLARYSVTIFSTSCDWNVDQTFTWTTDAKLQHQAKTDIQSVCGNPSLANFAIRRAAP